MKAQNALLFKERTANTGLSCLAQPHVRTGLAVLVLCLLSLMAAQQPSGMSDEERIVRTTYARLSFAIQVEEIHNLREDALSVGKPIDRAEFQKRLKGAELRFELTEFKVGNLSEISQTKYSDLVTKPSGDALDVSPGTWRLATEEPRETISAVAIARWIRSQSISENWDVPFGEIYPKSEVAGQHSRYATFKVKVNFQGRSREYRAMFLFGKDGQGNDLTLAGDTIININGGALQRFLNRNAYPETLIEGGVGKDPVIYEWLAAHQVQTGKKHEANCDVATLTCGVHSEDLKKLGKPSSRIDIQRRATSTPRLLDASFHLDRHALRPMIQNAVPSDCSKFNTAAGDTRVQSDDTLHITGLHAFTAIKNAGCTYTNGNNTNGACNTRCKVLMDAFWDESGLVATFCHVNAKDLIQDDQTGVGLEADCLGGAGGAVKDVAFCFLGSITLNVSKVGNVVIATSNGFLTVKDQQGIACAAQTQPSPTPTPTPNPGGGGGGGEDPCLGGPLDLTQDPRGPVDPLCSPVIVDLEGKGFSLTSAANGVRFDITGTGHPIQIAWTAPGAENGFLALDRNGNGLIDNGTELFGNFTPQPASAHPNGFLALAVYDKPDNGGNGDGVIDARDNVFSSLRIWVDANHDGVCQPEEMHALPEVGVFSLSLDYALSSRRDEFGNIFRYKARVNPEASPPGDEVGKKAYDVFLVTH